MAAHASIYPSFFEGFGLPVIESLSVGTPCIASCSSSLPEIGGPNCHYFDPYSVIDLYRALTEFQRNHPKRDPAFARACRGSVAGFNWPNMAHGMLRRIEREIRGGDG
jgi:glycosyltransferase involved in cell wall biosynthesis